MWHAAAAGRVEDVAAGASPLNERLDEGGRFCRRMSSSQSIAEIVEKSLKEDSHSNDEAASRDIPASMVTSIAELKLRHSMDFLTSWLPHGARHIFPPGSLVLACSGSRAWVRTGHSIGPVARWLGLFSFPVFPSSGHHSSLEAAQRWSA